MNKKHRVFLCTLVATIATAAAEGFPTSQFGHHDWYRPSGSVCDAGSTEMPSNTDAVTATATPQPTSSTTTVPEATKTPVPSTGDDYTTALTQVQEENMLNLLNQERILQGLSPLTLDPALSQIARVKSNDMKTNHYFAHESPTYGRVSEMLQSFGYTFTSAGENIAHHATTEKAHAAFMSSDGHRRNILSSAWQKVGIGIVYDANGYVYVTQIFVR